MTKALGGLLGGGNSAKMRQQAQTNRDLADINATRQREIAQSQEAQQDASTGRLRRTPRSRRLLVAADNAAMKATLG